MRKAFMAAVLMAGSMGLHADSDSELRAEILGEQGGKAIAADHAEHQPDVAKQGCGDLFSERWEDHFKEQGFDIDEATVESFIAGCMSAYNKKFGK